MVELLTRPHGACTSIRVGVRMRGSLCLVERTCVVASVRVNTSLYQYTLPSIHTTSYIHTLYQQKAQTLLKCMHTSVLPLSFYIFNSIQIHVYSLLCEYTYIHVFVRLLCVHVCMCPSHLCFHECVGVCMLVGVCAFVNVCMRQPFWRAEGLQTVSSRHLDTNCKSLHCPLM